MSKLHLSRVRPGRYIDLNNHVEIRRYDNDVTGRGVEWMLTIKGSWVSTERTKAAAVAVARKTLAVAA
jgi:hypothetical protein